MTSTISRRSARWGAGLALVVASTMATATPMAFAAPPSDPSGLTVTQPNDSTAVLSWAPSIGAQHYEVQVDDNVGFTSPDGGTVSTRNTSHVPTHVLKGNASYYWRVRAINSSRESSQWSQASFGSQSMGVPQLIAPTQGRSLPQPDEPPLLTWSAVPGADSYEVTVDGDGDLVSGRTYTTQHTSLVVPDGLGVGDWFWQVTAIKGTGNSAYRSMPSSLGTFDIESIKPPTLVSPINGVAVQDIVLDWQPVPGANSYHLQVSTNRDFTVGDARILDLTGILGTNYSPTTSFDNANYFWRVRAVDADGNASGWSNAGEGHFSRTYPHVPALVHPADGSTVTKTESYFQWAPVKHASEYELALSTSAGFSPANTTYCRVAGTTYTPGSYTINTRTGSGSFNRAHEVCRLDSAGTTYYWKVRALDRPFTKSGTVPGIQGEYSATRSFVYRPPYVGDFNPTGAATVDVPTLTWTANNHVSHYAVQIYDKDGRTVRMVETRATSYTLDGGDRLPVSGNPYSWSIRAINATGGTSLVHTGNQFRVSGNIPTTTAAPLTPRPQASGLTGPPQLMWEPHPSAAYYTVRVGVASDNPATQTWFSHDRGDLFGQPVPYPSMTDTSARLMQPGSYDWQVTAHTSDGAAIATGPEGRFEISPFAPTTGHVVAIDGGGFANGQACTASQGGCKVPATPTLKWDPDPRASFYMVYVSRDPEFTNLLEADTSIPATTNTMYTPTLSNREWTYADRTAGEGAGSGGDAYYWYVRPCRSLQHCGPSPVSTADVSQHVFQKESPRPTGLAPGAPQSSQTPNVLSGTEVNFSWNDYRDDNDRFVWDQTGERATQSAMQYRVQVSVDPTFGSLVDTALVDQTRYTAPKALYPDGTYYWRVQAVDSNDNGLSWSNTHVFRKVAPTVAALEPVGQKTAADSIVFRWQAETHATSYDVELYRNNDTSFSAANRVFTKNVKTTAYAHTEPIAPSDQAYLWRVRRTDAKGNKGPWSGGTSFRVSGSTPTIISPAEGASQPANAPMISWSAVAGAATYAVSLSPTSGSGTTESEVTRATAFAATKRFSTGTYSARVTARNASGGTIGAASVTFTVDAGLRATSPTRIEAPSGAGVGKTLTSVPPVWNQPDVTNSYQWLRDGATIRNATDTTYVITTADLNKAITLRVTGSKSNFDDGVSVSNAIGGIAGDSLTVITPPSITGTAASGSTLRVSGGSWSQERVSLSYQWSRNGADIPGATSTSYRLTPADAGASIRVTVTAAKTGYANGSVQTAPVTVAKLKSSTGISSRTAKIKKGKRAKVKVTVTVPGVSKPVGKIQILRGKKRIKTVKLKAKKNGSVTVKLPKLKKGKHKIRAKYLGNPTTLGSRSKVLKLTVART